MSEDSCGTLSCDQTGDIVAGTVRCQWIPVSQQVVVHQPTEHALRRQ